MKFERWISSALEYDYNNLAVFERAMRHRSMGSRNNERLEFLGDAVLGLVIANSLFQLEAGYPEGDLSRMRASLVNGRMLAELAAALSLGEHIELGPGEMKAGGHRRQSILADALEAVFGAIYLDGGYAAAEGVIQRLYAQPLANLPAPETLKDAKTRLQEYLQARQQPLPVYEVISHTGPSHDPTFTVHASIEALMINVQEDGRSRRVAEQKTAETILSRLLNE